MQWGKRVLTCVAGVAAIISMAGCGGSGNAGTSASPASDATQTITPSTGSESATLVAYFSATGGTLFEIEPAEPYTNDDLNYNDPDSRVSKEHDDESLRDVKLKTTDVSDWSSYTTMYIGYPIWWGEAAWSVNSFVHGNDFSGKTVIPFCTSASSPLGSSASELAGLATTGDQKEGQRFSSSANTQTVEDWVKQQA